ncbi:MAG: glutathione S-transferase family protein [Nevskiales bacterium]
MIELHQFAPAFNMPSPSPFCMKIEVFLRLAGLDYEAKVCPDPRKTPLGKLPFIKDGEKLVADSSSIIEYLVQVHGADLDTGLSEDERAIARAYTRMLEEHTYFGLLYCRWIDPAHWPTVRETFFGDLPRPIRGLLSGFIQGKIKRDLAGHGLGRHPPAEIYRRTAQDVAAVAAFLDGKLYFMGSEPTSIDATVYAFIGNMWEATLVTPLKDIVGKHSNLVAYCARMKQRCFG